VAIRPHRAKRLTDYNSAVEKTLVSLALWACAPSCWNHWDLIRTMFLLRVKTRSSGR